MIVKAYAKLNLSLLVVGVRVDGFHCLDSVFTAIDLHDGIDFAARTDKQINISFLDGNVKAFEVNPDSNTALSAAILMRDGFGLNGADISITKNIPLKAGLGGSSADAAGVINAYCGYYGIDVGSEKVLSLSRKIGADVPLMLKKGYKRLIDTKKIIEPIDSGLRLYFIIGMSDKSVLTKECFKKYDSMTPKTPKNLNTANDVLCASLSNGRLSYGHMTNDLYPAACALSDVADTVQILKNAGAENVLMTGSGAACFAVFESVAERELVLSKIPENALKVLTSAQSV